MFAKHTHVLALPASLRATLFRRFLSGTSIHASASTRNSSIDSNEVDHFNALASSWWDPHGSSRLLHLMNPLRHSFISSCLSSQSDAPDPGRKLHYLDVGCGGGIFAESAARLRTTASVTAIDPSSDLLAVAKAHARRDPMLSEETVEAVSGERRRRLRYINTSVEDLPLTGGFRKGTGTASGSDESATSRPPEQGYDVLTLFEVLEHVSDSSSFLEALLPLVRPGGWIVLSTIARTWTSWLTTKIVAEDILRMVPRGTHDWNKYINEAEIRRWFEQQSTRGQIQWTNPRAMGVVYLPAVGWKEVRRADEWGNYFFGVRRAVG